MTSCSRQDREVLSCVAQLQLSACRRTAFLSRSSLSSSMLRSFIIPWCKCDSSRGSIEVSTQNNTVRILIQVKFLSSNVTLCPENLFFSIQSYINIKLSAKAGTVLVISLFFPWLSLVWSWQGSARKRWCHIFLCTNQDSAFFLNKNEVTVERLFVDVARTVNQIWQVYLHSPDEALQLRIFDSHLLRA